MVGGTDVLHWWAVTEVITPVIEFDVAALRTGNEGSCSKFEGAVSTAGGGRLSASPRVFDAIVVVTRPNVSILS